MIASAYARRNWRTDGTIFGEWTDGWTIALPAEFDSRPRAILAGVRSRLRLPLACFCFQCRLSPRGISCCASYPADLATCTKLSLRGPLGRGFSLPASTRHVAFIPLGETLARLKPLLTAALGQGASVVMVSDAELPGLPPEVEIQSISALAEIAGWADYLALDVPRESLQGLRKMLGVGGQAMAKFEAQVLVHTPMPCGGMGECGVCAVTLRRGWKLACKDGPVFDLKDLI